MPSHLERFIRWFIVPLQVLKTIPNGDGAFVALSIGCSLCERYYRATSNTQDEHWKHDPFLEAAAADLNVDREFFGHFWNLYRNGMQHQGTPKAEPQKNKNTGRVTHYQWLISGDFSEVPTRIIEKDTVTICLNPWDFADYMVRKFLAHPDILTKAINHAFGGIGPVSTSCKPEAVLPKGPKNPGSSRKRPNP